AGNYTPNTSAAATADITARGLTVTATADNKTYDGTAAAVAHLADNRVGGDLLTLAYASATFDTKTVGTGKPVSVTGIAASGPDAGNYTANPAASATADITALGIAGSFTAQSRAYDGTTAAAITGRSLSGVLGTDDVRLAGGTAAFADKNVGTGKTVT